MTADAGNIERRLRKLRPYLERLEDNLLSQGDHPADEALQRAQRIRDEIKRNEDQLAALKAEAAAPSAVSVGDVIKIKTTTVLVGRVNHRTYTGWVIAGGQPATFAKHHFHSIVQRANPKLLEAVEHRAKIKEFFGDDKWHELLKEGIS